MRMHHHHRLLSVCTPGGSLTRAFHLVLQCHFCAAAPPRETAHTRRGALLLIEVLNAAFKHLQALMIESNDSWTRAGHHPCEVSRVSQIKTPTASVVGLCCH